MLGKKTNTDGRRLDIKEHLYWPEASS